MCVLNHSPHLCEFVQCGRRAPLTEHRAVPNLNSNPHNEFGFIRTDWHPPLSIISSSSCILSLSCCPCVSLLLPFFHHVCISTNALHFHFFSFLVWVTQHDESFLWIHLILVLKALVSPWTKLYNYIRYCMTVWYVNVSEKKGRTMRNRSFFLFIC